MAKSGLEKLVQKSQKLNQNVENYNVPQIRRNPQQLHDASVALARKRPLDERTKNKAQYLLAKKGYDTERLHRDLGEIDIKATFEPVQPLYETDLEGYLQREHETLLLTVIESAKKETIENFATNFSAYMEDEWEESKHELVEFFNQRESILSIGRRARGGAGLTMDGEVEQPRSSPLISGTHLTGNSSMTRNMLQYYRVVYELNESSFQKKPFDLVSRLYSAVLDVEVGDYQRKDLLNCWNLVKKILYDENSSATNRFISDPRSRKGYSSIWSGSENITNPLESSNMKSIHWLNGAREFLEEQYWAWIQSCINQNLQKARMGAMPAVEEFVKAFVNVILSGLHFPECHEKMSSGHPLWAVIYYTIRCGDLDTAHAIGIQNAASSGTFAEYLKHYIEKRKTGSMPEDIRVQITEEYRKILRQSKDPYKHIVFNLLGNCDPHRSHDDIYHWSTEDYMWLKINMLTFGSSVQESSSSLRDPSISPNISSTIHEGDIFSSNSGNQLTLQQFQKMLREYGPDHFLNPILYFQILLMSLQFEHALKYIESVNLYPVDSVHFTLTFYYYGALRLPTSPLNSPLSGDENGLTYFNFVRQLRQYVSHFAHTDILMALHYLYLIQEESIRHISIRDLVLETEEFPLLLGGITPDGTVKTGYLEKFVEPEQWREIVYLAATASKENGRYDVAIKLYDLSQYYEKVVDIMTKQLARVLTSQGPERTMLVDLASSLANKYQDARNVTRIEPRKQQAWDASLHSFLLLLGLCQFFDLYRNANYPKALEVMRDLDLVAFGTREMEAKVEAFRSLSDDVRRNFAEILLANMDCIYKIFTEVKESGLNAEREAYLQSIKSEAKALVMFAGMIQFRMPGDTHSRLVRMETAMA